MRIGELAKLTDTPARSLRYYEQQGLITPRRLDNGYREYDDYLVERVLQIRGLIDSGIPTRIIKQMLPCLGEPRTIVVEDADPELLVVLARERDRMNRRIECLIRNRDAVDGYMRAVAEASPTAAAAAVGAL
ncbi:MerR family transcriptional regulator [Streptomyces sp. NPDC088258]|uniref:MerR family transcriptional regulator n=1 Tax=Streptomyces sp. NPDC088258 TaxID=3365849 RepID=UPI00382DEBBF